MSSLFALSGQEQAGFTATTGKSVKAAKASDPRDDVSGEQFNEGLEFFARWGFRALQHALLKQTVDDVIAVRANRHAPPEVHISARWATTQRGHAAIEFLMPGVSVDIVVAKLYDNPEEFLKIIECGDGEEGASVLAANSATVRLDSFVAAQAFGEKPVIEENDSPLSIGESHFDEFPSGDDSTEDADNDRPGTTWG